MENKKLNNMHRFRRSSARQGSSGGGSIRGGVLLVLSGVGLGALTYGALHVQSIPDLKSAEGTVSQGGIKWTDSAGAEHLSVNPYPGVLAGSVVVAWYNPKEPNIVVAVGERPDLTPYGALLGIEQAAPWCSGRSGLSGASS